MITIFRKIRKAFIASGEARKYLVYAIGEIALVVIGILIALQINNWNESRQQQEQIEVYLQNLKNDLENNVLGLDRMASSNLFRLYSMQYLLQLAGQEKYDYKAEGNVIPEWKLGNRIWKERIPEGYHKDFIQLAFLWSHRLSASSINTTTFDELKSTGSFSQIKNEKLKSEIHAYYNLFNFRITGSLPGNFRNVANWHQSLTKEGIVNSNPFLIDDPISLLRDNKERVGILRQLCRGATWLAEGAPIVAEEAKHLIQLIDHELGNEDR